MEQVQLEVSHSLSHGALGVKRAQSCLAGADGSGLSPVPALREGVSLGIPKG